MKKITYLLMLLVFLGVPIQAGVNHPSFSSETIFLECDGIKVSRETKTYYLLLRHR